MHEQVHFAIAYVLKDLFKVHNELLLYFPEKKFLDIDASFSKSLQVLELNAKSITKSLQGNSPFSTKWNDKDVLIQRIVFKNQLSSFEGPDYKDKSLFCPYLSHDDADTILAKCKKWSIKIIALCEINNLNKNLPSLFEEKKDITDVLPSIT